MANTVTIKFRAKRIDCEDGEQGYKVPTLTHSHLSVSERDTLGTALLQNLEPRLLRSRLQSYAGLTLPEVVWADEPNGWTITPIGKGFMADVSITRPLERKRDAA